MDAIAQYIAKMQDDDRDYVAKRDRVRSDARYIALSRYAESLKQEVNAHGQAGFGQMMLILSSAQNFRQMRAADLAVAREGQIKGMHGYVKAWLKRAAAHRRDEKQMASVSLNAATDAFCDALMAPYRIAAE